MAPHLLINANKLRDVYPAGIEKVVFGNKKKRFCVCSMSWIVVEKVKYSTGGLEGEPKD
jgi:hypothetical protein